MCVAFPEMYRAMLALLSHPHSPVLDMTNATTELLTTGDLARELSVSLDKIDYVLSKYNIRPDCRAGILRLFRRDQLPAIRRAILNTTRTIPA